MAALGRDLEDPAIRGRHVELVVDQLLALLGGRRWPRSGLEAGIARAGSINLRLLLTPSGRRALAKSNSNLLALRVAVSFKPSDGGAGSSRSKFVIFRWRQQGRRDE